MFGQPHCNNRCNSIPHSTPGLGDKHSFTYRTVSDFLDPFFTHGTPAVRLAIQNILWFQVDSLEEEIKDITSKSIFLRSGLDGSIFHQIEVNLFNIYFKTILLMP